MRRRPHPFWLVLLLACDPNAGTEVGNPTYGCSDAGAGKDDDPGCQWGSPTFLCAGAPCHVLDFGEVPVGQEARVTLEIRYDCEPVTLLAPVAEGGPVFLDGPGFPAHLGPDLSREFTVGFTPTVPGSTGGDLVFPLDPTGEWHLPWTATGL
jgi:hypothetical protein